MKNNPTLNAAIGRRVQYYRQEKNLSQDELSEIIGCTTTYMSVLERGKSSYTAEKIIKICSALNISADRLLFEDQSMGIAAPILCRLAALDDKNIVFVERFLDLYITSLE